MGSKSSSILGTENGPQILDFCVNIQGYPGWSLKLESKFRSHFWAQLQRFFHTREARSGFHSSSLREKQISLSVGSSLVLCQSSPKIRTAGSKAAKCELVWNRNSLTVEVTGASLPFRSILLPLILGFRFSRFWCKA